MFPRSISFAYGDPAKRESKSTSFTLKAPCPLWRPPFGVKTPAPACLLGAYETGNLVDNLFDSRVVSVQNVHIGS